MGEHLHVFQSRLSRLDRKHKGMSKGYKAQLRPDGLIVIEPRRTAKRVSLLPLLLFVAAFFVFKGFLIAFLGGDTYGDRVARLNEGTSIERIGAFVMQQDPLAQALSEQISPVLH